jgi:putative acetyltransferase
MEIRRYRPEDLEALAALFRDSVTGIACRDYSPEQIRAWAAAWEGLRQRGEFFSSLYTLTAWEGEQLAGYGCITRDGYLDHLYVHPDFQRRGVASALCGALEEYAFSAGAGCVTVHASITARPLFEKRGYRLLRERRVERRGVVLVNSAMEKKKSPFPPPEAGRETP